MKKTAGAALFLALAALFLIVNRGAYEGYFQDDEIDNLSWAPLLPAADYLKGALTPLYQKNNFRPAGHFYFHAVESFAGLNFPPYVAVIHALHLFNVWLIWVLARRLGARPWMAGAGCVFFAFHMALFDAVWKPMYVFDVLCATFSLLSLLAYAARRWILSFIAFWLAYKSKELAVMLPAALLLYEYWFGDRKWLRLAPFFAVSLSFGLQGLFLNPNKDNDYSFRFTLPAVVKTSAFYAGRVFLVPYLGFVLILAAFMARHRRVWLGTAMAGLFLVPLLFLPGRMFAAYCYVPFTGLALAFTGLAEAASPAAVALFFLLWIPVDYRELRTQRRATLASDAEVREYVATLIRFARTKQPFEAVVYSGQPERFNSWGVEGAVHYVFRGRDLPVHFVETDAGREALKTRRTAYLDWDYRARRLEISVHPAAVEAPN